MMRKKKKVRSGQKKMRYSIYKLRWKYEWDIKSER